MKYNPCEACPDAETCNSTTFCPQADPADYVQPDDVSLILAMAIAPVAPIVAASLVKARA